MELFHPSFNNDLFSNTYKIRLDVPNQGREMTALMCTEQVLKQIMMIVYLLPWLS